jgi:hypothetical protein
LPALLRCRLPAGLRHLDLSFNKLTCLPPALRAASGLTSLHLSVRQLELTAADVDSTLVHLAQLVELQAFSLAGRPWVLLPHLQQCVPQLKANFGRELKEDDCVGGECACPKCQMTPWGYGSSSSDDSDYW